jgi:hypothetical protein
VSKKIDFLGSAFSDATMASLVLERLEYDKNLLGSVVFHGKRAIIEWLKFLVCVDGRSSGSNATAAELVSILSDDGISVYEGYQLFSDEIMGWSIGSRLSEFDEGRLGLVRHLVDRITRDVEDSRSFVDKVGISGQEMAGDGELLRVLGLCG